MASRPREPRDPPDPLDQLRKRRTPGSPPGGTPPENPDFAAYVTIADVAVALASTSDPTRILNQIVDGIIQVTGCERGFLMLREADGKFSTFTGRYADAAEWDEADAREISATVRDRVVDTRGVFVGSDLRGMDDFKSSSSIQAGGIVAAVCLPLMYKDDLVGVIYADSTHMLPRPLEGREPVLKAFGAQASFAIENARVHGDLGARRDSAARSAHRMTGDGLASRNPAMRDVIATVEALAPSPLTVLITGETGTGKEVFARAIHRLSPRAESKFIAVNSAGLPQELVESILFGHRKGAFTSAVADRPGVFEVADGGSLFLDEIGEMPLGTQPKLLRALENREISRVGDEGAVRKVNVRIIAATNRDLAADVAAGIFRKDLYARLHQAEVQLPPLRDRREDIIPLAEYFLDRYAEEQGIKTPRLSSDARALLVAESWTNNVRGLKNAIEFGIQFRDAHNVIHREAIERQLASGSHVRPLHDDEGSLVDRVERFEAEQVRRALAKHGGNVSRTADALGISRQALHSKMNKYGIVAREG